MKRFLKGNKKARSEQDEAEDMEEEEEEKEVVPEVKEGRIIYCCGTNP
jgi:hypothetical protein